MNSGYRLTEYAAQYAATQINSKINEVQKQIGAKKKAKENADDLMKQKIELDKEKKSLVDSAAEKDTVLKKKVATVGNLVHDSVPVNNNEVWPCASFSSAIPNMCLGFQHGTANMGARGSYSREERCPFSPRGLDETGWLRSRARSQGRWTPRILPQEMGCVLEPGHDQLRTRIPRLARIHALTGSAIHVEGPDGQDCPAGGVR